MKICIGITNGSIPMLSDFPEDCYLWRAGPGGGIAVKDRDDLQLEVPAYDQTRSALVEIVLRRKGCETPLYRVLANSLNLLGQPQLAWMDRYPHVAGVER